MVQIRLVTFIPLLLCILGTNAAPVSLSTLGALSAVGGTVAGLAGLNNCNLLNGLGNMGTLLDRLAGCSSGKIDCSALVRELGGSDAIKQLGGQLQDMSSLMASLVGSSSAPALASAPRPGSRTY